MFSADEIAPALFAASLAGACQPPSARTAPAEPPAQPSARAGAEPQPVEDEPAQSDPEPQESVPFHDCVAHDANLPKGRIAPHTYGDELFDAVGTAASDLCYGWAALEPPKLQSAARLCSKQVRAQSFTFVVDFARSGEEGTCTVTVAYAQWNGRTWLRVGEFYGYGGKFGERASVSELVNGRAEAYFQGQCASPTEVKSEFAEASPKALAEWAQLPEDLRTFLCIGGET